ncbi:MAG: hypothetical protein SV765_10865 [Pseudomonadota bacterium]|nr:hypothetical protein [Pseudomonadota bacterium]
MPDDQQRHTPPRPQTDDSRHLALQVEQQIAQLKEQLGAEMERRIGADLIHTITDSKLHQLNLELRQHLTLRLDTLLQDIKDEQQQLRRELEACLPDQQSPGKVTAKAGALPMGSTRAPTLAYPAPSGDTERWRRWEWITLWLAATTMLALLFSWHTLG